MLVRRKDASYSQTIGSSEMNYLMEWQAITRGI